MGNLMVQNTQNIEENIVLAIIFNKRNNCLLGFNIFNYIHKSITLSKYLQSD